MSYQWLFNGAPITGATNAAYTIPSTATNHPGLYSVTVTNVAGGTLSTAAQLSLDSVETAAVITLYGLVGTPYRVDWSDGMATNTWTVLTNVTLSSSPFVILDLSSTHSHKRFYRGVQQ